MKTSYLIILDNYHYSKLPLEFYEIIYNRENDYSHHTTLYHQEKSFFRFWKRFPGLSWVFLERK